MGKLRLPWIAEELKYTNEVVAVTAFCIMISMMGLLFGDIMIAYVFYIFPSLFCIGAMWKEGRL